MSKRLAGALIAVGLVIAGIMAGGPAPANGDYPSPDVQLATAIAEVNAPAARADLTSLTDSAEDATGTSIQGTVDVTSPVPPPLHPHRGALPDAGTAANIAAVKAAVVYDLQRDREIMRPSTVPPNLQAQLAEVYATAVLDTVTGETAAGIEAAAADPNYPSYSSARFVVTQWQGVQATPAAAVVTLLGYDSWQEVSGAVVDDPVRQWQIVMAFDGSGWKLVQQIPVELNEIAARDSDDEFSGGLPRMP